MNPAHTCPRCGVQLAPGTPPEKCPRCLLGLAVALGEDADSHSVAARGDRPPVPTPEELAPGFPQLEILEVIGQGGMGVVYRARQKGLDREVALKVLHVDEDAGPAFAERFAREARALASLTHSNIVAVHDSGVTDGRYWLLMEYVDGANLRVLIRGGEVVPTQALNLVSQLCEALNYAHEQGVVHRDIKPENILVDRGGRVKIADFGLAKLLRRAPEVPTLTGPRQAMGTYHYMAPEQIERPLEVDHRADIYSMGVVFYELLTGELPIGRFGAPSEKLGVDVRLDEIVLRSLAKEPQRRYQHASEVKTRVDAIREGGPSWRDRRAAHAAAARDSGDEPRRGWRGHSVGALVAVGCMGSIFLAVAFALGLAFLGSAVTHDRARAEMEARSAADHAMAAQRQSLDELHARILAGDVPTDEVLTVAEAIVANDRGAAGSAAFLDLVESDLFVTGMPAHTGGVGFEGELMRIEADIQSNRDRQHGLLPAHATYQEAARNIAELEDRRSARIELGRGLRQVADSLEPSAVRTRIFELLGQ